MDVLTGGLEMIAQFDHSYLPLTHKHIVWQVTVCISFGPERFTLLLLCLPLFFHSLNALA